MTLRSKTLLIIGVVLAGLIAAVYAISSTVLLDGFAGVEKQDTDRNVQRVQDALSEALANLGATTSDYAEWDDTYAFIEDANTAYAKANLVDSVFTNLELNVMLFVRPSGEVVGGKAFDLQKKMEVPVPPGMQEHVSVNSPLLRHPDTESGVTGIVLLPEGPMLVAALPILTSERQGPIRGTLIMGRYLDSVQVERLAKLTHLSLTLHRLDNPQMPPDFQAVASGLTDEAPTRVQPLGADSIAGYTRLSDIYGRPVLVLRVDTPRLIYRQGQDSVRYVLVSLLAVGLVFAVLVVWFLEKSVLSRLARLNSAVRRLGAGGDLSVPVAMTQLDGLSSLARSESGDEIGTLAVAFNRMTAQLRGLIDSLDQQVAARTQQLRASADVGRAAASILVPDRLLREVVNLITERFGFSYAAVFTLDEAGKFAVLREAKGPHDAGSVLKQRGHKLEVGGRSMVGTATATRQPRIALDVGKEAVRFANPLLPDTRSEIALPLVVGDRVLGALDVQSTQAAAFDEAGVAVLQSMADQVAVALANAHSFEAVQAALQTTTRLYDLSRALFAAASPHDAYTALSPVWSGLAEFERITLLLIAARDVTGEPIEYEVAAEWSVLDGVLIEPGVFYAPAQWPLAGLARPDETVIVRDAHDPGVPAPTRQLLQQAGLESTLLVPLIVRGQSAGLLAAVASQPLGDDHAIRFTQSVVEQLSLVLSNLRLNEETRAALDRVALLNQRLTGEAWRDYRIGRADRVAASGRPDMPEPTSRVAAPIVLRGQTLGTLTLEDAGPDRQWSDDERELLNAIAGEVALTIENARLIEQTQHTAHRERALRESTDRIRLKTGMDRILQTAAEELARHLQASRVAVRLDGLTDGGDAPAGNGRGGDHG